MRKLAVSNIAWRQGVETVLEIVADAGATGIEVAPAQVAGWDVLDARMMAAYRDLCQGFGLSIPSFQAFLFGKPELQLLDELPAFRIFEDHTRRVCELAAIAGAEILVFGAPKNRLTLGHDEQHARKLATERLSSLAEIAWESRTSIGLEAVPAHYGAEMITNYQCSLEIVREISHPGLVFHLDTGCTWLDGESIANAIREAKQELRHFHVSQPDLASFSDVAQYHADASDALSEIGYGNWLCIEMKSTASPGRSVHEAITAVRDIYGI